MNTFTKSLILSVSAALISVSASAAPQSHPSEQHHQVQHSTQSTTHHQHGQTQKNQSILPMTGKQDRKFQPSIVDRAIKLITANTENSVNLVISSSGSRSMEIMC